MTKNEFKILNAIFKSGRKSYSFFRDNLGVSVGLVSKTMNEFDKLGYIDTVGITEKGISALEPYRVRNAVILAAGMGSHFVPMTLEKPKGLLSVKNEILIERQIEQLQEAGIQEIILILGYKKEAFFYLESKYEGIRIIINPEYHIKNNTHSLFLAEKYIGCSYICSADNYFEGNPFEKYVYQSYYSGMHVDKITNEWYMHFEKNGTINKIDFCGKDGYIMIGHAYWNSEFSDSMMTYLRESEISKKYEQTIWEHIMVDHVKELPTIEAKIYPDESIFEFDNISDLRQFDYNYIDHTNIKIMKNIAMVLKCKESDIIDFIPIKEGLTNSSFVFKVNGEKYVYRHPGEGTEAIISRSHEKKALVLAKTIGVDPTFMYMDEEKGWKISKFISNVRVPDYYSDEDSNRVLAVLRRLHDKKITVDWSFLPWEEAEKIELLLKSSGEGIVDQGFDLIKANVRKCYNMCEHDGIEMCFCHCDTYAPNWMFTEDETILIDWEYSGNADPGCDVGTYIMDSMWEVEKAEYFINQYFNGKASNTQMFHFLAYTAIVSYYWYVWALYRESGGTIMGESLYNWRTMAKRFSDYLVEKYGL